MPCILHQGSKPVWLESVTKVVNQRSLNPSPRYSTKTFKSCEIPYSRPYTCCLLTLHYMTSVPCITLLPYLASHDLHTLHHMTYVPCITWLVYLAFTLDHMTYIPCITWLTYLASHDLCTLHHMVGPFFIILVYSRILQCIATTNLFLNSIEHELLVMVVNTNKIVCVCV